MQLLPHETASLNIASIRDRLVERLPAYMIPSLWIAIARFPLMPSGKMDRRRVGSWLEHMDQDTYRVVSAMGSEALVTDHASAVESKLQTIFAKVLNLPTEDVRLNQSFLHLGGDSIAAMQVSSQCRAQGLPINVQDIIRSKSIAALAATVDLSLVTHAAPQVLEYNLPFDLSPIQKVFFETVGESYQHFNQTEIFRIARNFEAGEIRAALTTLVEIHPMLRVRFARNEAGVWQQRVEKDVSNSFRLRHHRVQSANDATLRSIVDHSQATLDVANGPLFAIDLFELDDTFSQVRNPTTIQKVSIADACTYISQVIVLVAHHLIIDVVSWGVLLEDLEVILNGSKPLPQSLPYHSWLQQQSVQVTQETAKRVLPVGDIPPASFDYWGMEDRPNISRDAIEEDVQLTTRDTMLLLGAQEALATEILDILVAALFESFRKVFPDRVRSPTLRFKPVSVANCPIYSLQSQYTTRATAGSPSMTTRISPVRSAGSPH
jgi:aryl carrier-like protein